MTVIKVENLGKKYLIGHDKKAGGVFQYNSMRDSIAHSFRGMYQRFRHPLSPNKENTELEEFWALKDINFEIKQGDRVGIIGHNGAGKTTLLKLLSRITQPSTGSIKIKGRIASLLEVGTGFHPELSGRENIYLNGAILGMKRVEIKKKFDEIVAFAEVEKFLDTPVKRYSSGMYVRLAFAVAAHLEPEILLVDEVLAVGDAEFQKKSIGKMEDVSKEGRTIIFVSHNMGVIKKLCNRGVVLQKGKLSFNNHINKAVNSYESTLIKKNTNKIIDLQRVGDLGRKILISKVSVFNENNKKTDTLSFNEMFFLEIEIQALNQSLKNLTIGVRFETFNDVYITSCLSQDSDTFFSIEANDTKRVKIEFMNLYLNPGEYYLTLSIRKGKTFFDQIIKAKKVIVLDYSKDKNVVFNNAWGLIKINSNWMNLNNKNEKALY